MSYANLLVSGTIESLNKDGENCQAILDTGEIGKIMIKLSNKQYESVAVNDKVVVNTDISFQSKSITSSNRANTVLKTSEVNNSTYVTLLGRIGSQPEIKTIEGGKQLAKFSVATSTYSYETKGQVTSWFNCTAWDRTATTIQNYVKKGNLFLSNGYLKRNSYTNKEGVKVSTVDVIITSVVLLPKSFNASNNEVAASSTPIATNQATPDFF